MTVKTFSEFITTAPGNQSPTGEVITLCDPGNRDWRDYATGPLKDVLSRLKSVESSAILVVIAALEKGAIDGYSYDWSTGCSCVCGTLARIYELNLFNDDIQETNREEFKKRFGFKPFAYSDMENLAKSIQPGHTPNNNIFASALWVLLVMAYRIRLEFEANVPS